MAVETTTTPAAEPVAAEPVPVPIDEPLPTVNLLRRARARVALGPLAEVNASPTTAFERVPRAVCLLPGRHGGPRIEIDLPDGAHVDRALMRLVGEGPTVIRSEIDGVTGPTALPGTLAGQIVVEIAREAHRVVLLPESDGGRICFLELILEGTSATTFERDRMPPVSSLPVLAAPTAPLTAIDAPALHPATDARAPLGALRFRSGEGTNITYELALVRMARDHSGRPLLGTGGMVEGAEDPSAAYPPPVPWEERWSDATAGYHEMCGREQRRLVLTRSTGVPADRVERTLAEVCAVVSVDLATRDEDGDGAPEIVLSMRGASEYEGYERTWIVDAGTFFVERATFGTSVRAGERTEVRMTESAGPPREVRLTTGDDAIVEVYAYDPALDGYARTLRIDESRPWEREDPTEHPLLRALRVSSAELSPGGPPSWALAPARGTAAAPAVPIGLAVLEVLARAEGASLGRVDASVAARWQALPPLIDAAAIEQASEIEREVIAAVTGECEGIDMCPRPPIGAAQVAIEVSAGLAGTAEAARFVSATERTLSNLAEADETFDADAVREALFRAAVAAAHP